jgi:two-component system NarL family sensor kinase
MTGLPASNTHWLHPLCTPASSQSPRGHLLERTHVGSRCRYVHRSAFGSLLTYCLSAQLPPGCLVIDQHRRCLSCVWVQHHLSRKSIKFQPQELADRLLEVQENERHRLSRELHDDIGQLLTAAKLQSEWLKRRRMPDEFQGQCSSLCDTLDETLAQSSRCIGHSQSPATDQPRPGSQSACTFAQDAGQHAVNWSLDCHQRLTGIPEEMAVAAFRITQEAVTNILRHAQAKNLLIRACNVCRRA